jgi:CheY-like chemotaxis protein
MRGEYNMAKKIMLVDDEPDVITVTVTRLETSGYEVLVVKDAEEALDILNKKADPDLILLDLLLPKMQGNELCKKLKSDIKFKDIPIILFTASAIRVPEKVVEMGADDYILKPFDDGELLFKIKRFIG